MQIISIHLKNIKSHRDTELDFSPGINVLSGPNGVGKSTIFEAIGYALFGVDAQSFVGNVERFISIGCKRGEIAVVFEVADGERFRVSRTVATPSKWLLSKEFGDAFEVEEHKDSKETEARLKELLGLDSGRSLAEQFELVIGPFQHEFLGPFVIKQPAKRRDKFDEILGIDSWRKTFNETKQLASAIKAKVESLESAIGPLQDQVAVLPEKRKAHKTAKEECVETAALYKKQQQGLKELETRLAEIDKREQALKELGAEVETLKERIGNGKEKVGSQKSLIAEAEKAKQVVADNRSGKEAYKKVEARLHELRERQKVQRQLEQQVAELKTTVGKLDTQYKVEEKSIAEAGREIETETKSLEQKRKSLAVDESVRKLAARLPEIREAISKAQTRLGLLKGRRDGLEEGQEKLGEGICPFFQEPCMNIAEKPPGDLFSASFAALDNKREKLQATLQKLEKEESRASAASESIQACEVQLKGLDDQARGLDVKQQANQARKAGLKSLQKDQLSARQQLDERQKTLQAYNELQDDIETAEAEQKQHQRARDLYVANQDQAAKLDGLQADLKEFETLLTALQEQLAGKGKELAAASQGYDADQHQLLKLRKDTLWQEVGALGQKVESLKVDIERLAGEIDRLKQIAEDIAAKKVQIRGYREKDELVKFLRNRVFRKVSGYLSERFREEISRRANRIYRIIAEVDEELAWGEDYRIVLRDMLDGELRERYDDQLSGGQTMSAVVALRLAMLQTIGARIAFFDEPTSNLDVIRRENLAHAFRAIDVGKEEATEHWYDQLFLISHDVAFAEITDQILTLGNCPA
jgi:exonuclease SbcC